MKFMSPVTFANPAGRFVSPVAFSKVTGKHISTTTDPIRSKPPRNEIIAREEHDRSGGVCSEGSEGHIPRNSLKIVLAPRPAPTSLVVNHVDIIPQ